MWLPNDERELLKYYYSKLTNKCEKWKDLDKPVLIDMMKSFNTYPIEGVDLENEVEIMDKPYFQRINEANELLIKRKYINIKRSENGCSWDRHGMARPKMLEVCLTLEGCDLARKYSNWFNYIGLWWGEYRSHPIWIAVGFIFGAILSPLIINYFNQHSVQKEQNTKQEIRTLFEAVSPQILKKIDNGEKDILIAINVPKEVGLINISQSPDFNKYMSLKQEHDRYDETGCITDPNDVGKKSVYHIYPKDALMK